LSMTQVERVLLKPNAFFLFSFFSSFILFYIVYNYIVTYEDPLFIVKLLIIVNAFVAIYCFLQLFFIDLPILNKILIDNRQERLAGPFIVGLTAEYLAIQSIFLLYMIMAKVFPSWNKYMYALCFLNFSFLIATGNRGGFLVLLGGLFLFFVYFRKTFNLTRLFIYASVMGLVFILASIFILQNTKYNVLFSRLSETEFKEGLPDSRKNPWPMAWEAFVKKPVLGHGPRMGFEPGVAIKSTTYIAFYPHNLYLYVLVTMGIVGLFAYLNLFAFIYLYIQRARKKNIDNAFLRNMPTLFLIMFFMFIIDQMKIEFIRFHVNAYQHYMFILFGLFLGASNLIVRSQRKGMPA
jgi:O-antigen ligase